MKLLFALCVLCGRIEKAEINFVWQLFVQQHLMLSAPAFFNYIVQLFTINVSTSKSMVKCKINIDTDFTDYTDFHNNYQSV